MPEMERNTKLSWRHYDNTAQAGDTFLHKMVAFTGSVTPPAALAANTSGETTFTCYGVNAPTTNTTGDYIVAMVPPTLETGLVFSGIRVSANNTIAVRFTNCTAAPITGSARVWSFLWFNAANV